MRRIVLLRADADLEEAALRIDRRDVVVAQQNVTVADGDERLRDGAGHREEQQGRLAEDP